MKFLNVILIMLVSSCGMVDIADPIYVFSDSLQSFSVAGVEAKIDGNLVTAKVPDTTNLRALTPVFTTSNAFLYVNGEQQKSGKSVQDFTNDVRYQAVTYSGKKATFIVRVSKAGDTVVESYSNVIKVESIDDIGVTVSIERSPMSALLGITANDIEYCVNVSVTDTNFMLHGNDKLKYVSDMVCLETYSYEDLPTSFDFVDGKEVMINYVAIHDGVKFIYNRLYIKDGMEFFTGTCEELFNPDNDNGEVVLTENLDCSAVVGTYSYGDVYLNGNGYTIYNMYGAIQGLNMSYVANINFSNVDGLAKEISFSLIENVSFSDTNMFRDGDAGLVAGKLFDVSINNLDINANIYSSGDHNGLIAGRVINNFPMIPIVMSRIRLNGIVNGGNLVGGAFGFLMSYTQLKDMIINVEVAGTGDYVDCLAGAVIDEPEKLNVQEQCN